jgi:acylphosphatase
MFKTHGHVDIRVTGVVQGVWFRKSACEEGLRLGLSGCAQNLPDGSVAIEAEGEQEMLDAFVRWCRKGPPLAKVDHVEVREGDVIGHVGFIIRK